MWCSSALWLRVRPLCKTRGVTKPFGFTSSMMLRHHSFHRSIGKNRRRLQLLNKLVFSFLFLLSTQTISFLQLKNMDMYQKNYIVINHNTKSLRPPQSSCSLGTSFCPLFSHERLFLQRYIYMTVFQLIGSPKYVTAQKNTHGKLRCCNDSDSYRKEVNGFDNSSNQPY